MLKAFTFIITFLAGMAFCSAITQNSFHWASFAICVIMMLLCLRNRNGVEYEKGDYEKPRTTDEPIEITFDDYYNEIPLS